MLSRGAHLRRLREETFDLVVVGGGITGAAAARDAARRGLRTALVEARDFGQGTSSRSSRLVHGGLRYLEQLEFELVFEASRERRTLLRIARHLVRPLEFTFPVYRDGRIGRRRLDAGMWLYDALSLFRNIERHRMLSARQVLSREPGIKSDGLLGGARFFDAQVDDARLVLATVLAAAEEGAAVANRLEAVELRSAPEGGAPEEAVHEVVVRDAESDGRWPVDGRAVLMAGGPWTDQLLRRAGVTAPDLVRPSRGSHVHVRRRRLGHERALIFESPVDGRIMFVLPWRDLTLIGTTDDFDDVSPDEVAPTAEDVDYLLASTNGLFPEARLEPADVVSSWAGLRPLATAVEEGGGATESEVSRDFAVREGPEGVFAVVGGKLTSHRAMGEEAIDRVAAHLAKTRDRSAGRSDTDRAPLPGGDFEDPDDLRAAVAQRGSALGVPPEGLDRLCGAHGTRAGRILDLVEARPELGGPLVADHPYLAAEAVYAVREEMALHAVDVAFRRTRLGLEAGSGFEAAARRIVELMADELGWDECARDEEVARMRSSRARDEAWRSRR